MASTSRISSRFGTVNSHLYDKLDFDCHARRQAGNSDCGSRMTAILSKYLLEDGRSGIGNRRKFMEIGDTIHVGAQLDNALYGVQGFEAVVQTP
jgi:hypothetical protein